MAPSQRGESAGVRSMSMRPRTFGFPSARMSIAEIVP